MKKFAAVLTTVICLFVVCVFGLTACNSGEDTGVKLNKTEITLEIGDSETLTATVSSDGAVVTWSSDNSAVATVADGKVTALAKGTAVITASAESKTATCTVTVVEKILPVDPTPVDPVAVESVMLNKSTLTLDIGGTETLTATVKPDNATNKTVAWESDKPAIAKVENGKVTALAEGTATITATADGKSDVCTVTVNKTTEQPPAVKANKYAEIVTALETEIGKTYTNPKVLTLYDYNGFLACVATMNGALYSIRAKVSTTEHSLSADTIDTKYFTDNITGTRLTQLGYFAKGVYSYDGTDEEKQMVESMITKLLGDGYSIIWGAVSGTNDRGTVENLGEAAQFTVSALLEKNGSIFRYETKLTVSKGYGDVYQTVLKSTAENKDKVYKVENSEITDLGEVAALYRAEVKRVAATQN